MLTKKAVGSLAKKFASMSFDDSGNVDKTRVRAVLDVISEYSERMRPLLRRKYFYFLDQCINQKNLVIEYSGSVDIDKIKTFFETKLQYPVHVKTMNNPELLAGVRVRINDMIMERSLLGDINSLR